MSTHTAARLHVTLPRVPDFVDTLTESASAAIANFDAPKLKSVNREIATQRSEVGASMWVPQSPQQSAGFSKLTAFAVVVVAHVLAYYVLVNLSPNFRDAMIAPLQVVMLAEVANNDEVRPPLPQPRLQQFDLPIEPVILTVADPDATPITVVAQQQQQASAPAQTSAVAAPKIVTSVEYVREPSAKYPPAARALKQRGTVTLRALIDTDGRAREVNVQKTSGFRLLDDAARSAVLNALFKPYMENGRSQSVYVFIPIEFGAATT
ncbi:MAG TPA: energy transducer TonB [Steroidobacteraceae bacterium]|nr:energy transducer TonB [Steroidobacteraceae bacterium]